MRTGITQHIARFKEMYGEASRCAAEEGRPKNTGARRLEWTCDRLPVVLWPPLLCPAASVVGGSGVVEGEGVTDEDLDDGALLILDSDVGLIPVGLIIALSCLCA